MLESMINNNLPTNNNLLNNLYANQINPNLITPISLNNFVPQNVPNVPFISPAFVSISPSKSLS